MATVQKTLSECLDDAVAIMPIFRQLAWRGRLKFPGFRRKTLAELRERLHDDERLESIVMDDGTSLARKLAEDSFTSDTPFAIDIDKLRELLKLILEFLPLILKLFSGFSAILIALILLPSVADAQLFGRFRVQQRSYSNCPNGICPTSTRVVQSYSSRGHWTHPGSIEGHMASTHGQDVSGLTREQLLDNHDALHEGRPIPHRAAQRVAVVRSARPSLVPIVSLRQPAKKVAAITKEKVGWL